jgi:hypothetical protein
VCEEIQGNFPAGKVEILLDHDKVVDSPFPSPYYESNGDILFL